MKISNKEKILLVIFSFLLILFLYYSFVLRPQNAHIRELEEKKNQVTTKFEDTKKLIASYGLKEQEYKKLNANIAGKTQRLLPILMQEKIITTLNVILKNAKLDEATIAFSLPKDGVKKDAAQNKNGTTKDEILKKEILGATITYKGNFAAVTSFIHALEDFGKKTVITEITLAGGGTGELTGAANLEFYALPEVYNEDKEYLKWEYENGKYGKVDPFVGDWTSSVVNANKTDIGKKENRFDFLMTMKPITADLPAVILGKAEDDTRASYITADNANAEPMEMEFTQAGGKYYYKYKTTRESYPKLWAGNGIEFVPFENSINFKIFSNARNSVSDTSGANIKIVNKTDKAVNVLVHGDDKTRPRITITKEGLNIERKDE